MGRLVIKKGQIDVKTLFEWYETPVGEPEAMTFNFPIQRPEMLWNNEKRSRFIHAIFMNDPIPPLYITHDKDDNMITKMVLDGKQRLTTLYNFIHNKFQLWKYTPDYNMEIYLKDDNGKHIFDEFGNKKYRVEPIKLAGKKFKALPQHLQKTLLNSLLECVFISDYTDDDLARIMYNLNNGQATTQTQKSIMKLGMEVGTYIQKLTENDLFQNRFVLKERERKASELHRCVLFSLMLWTGQQREDVTYNKLSSANDLSKFSEKLRGLWSEMDLNAMDNMFTLLDNVLPEDNEICDKHLRSSHLPVLVMNVDRYLSLLDDELITEEQYREFLLTWFQFGVTSEEYTQYEGRSINDRANVEARVDFMSKCLDEFLGIETEDKAEEGTFVFGTEDRVAEEGIFVFMPASDLELYKKATDTLLALFDGNEDLAWRCLAEIDVRSPYRHRFNDETLSEYRRFFLLHPDLQIMSKCIAIKGIISGVEEIRDSMLVDEYHLPILVRIFFENVEDDYSYSIEFCDWLKELADPTRLASVSDGRTTFASQCTEDKSPANAGVIANKFALLRNDLLQFIKNKSN